MWLERLQTLIKGEVWGGSGQESEVRVNEELLSQLVSQGFDRAAAQIALQKTKNDDFAALLILTCPEDTSDSASRPKSGEEAGEDSDEAKEQRFLDFFRDLGDQYWGWQNESAKRGRGFKGALKENFLPLLNDLRQLASEDLPFSSSPAIAYHAMCFLNRGFDECPPITEDRDRDRHRMSLETAHIVPALVKRIEGFSSDDYRSSLVCELVKETFAVLDKLVVSTVTARLSDKAREAAVRTIVGFITDFYTRMEVSKDNAGLPGASGKLSAVLLHPAIRSLSLFVSIPACTTAAHLRQIASQVALLGEFLEKNDPAVVEAVLSALSSFIQPFSRLSLADCDAVLGPLMADDGPLSRRLLRLLASSTHPKTHALVVSFLSSVCLLSAVVVEQLVGAACGQDSMSTDGGEPAESPLVEAVARSLTLEGSQVRARGVLKWLDALLSCLTEGHAAQKKDRPTTTTTCSIGGSGVRLVVEDAEVHRRLSESMVDDDMEELELREMLDADELRDEEAQFRSRSGLEPSERRRSELEVRLHRIRRAKISRIQEARMRRRFNPMGADPPPPAAEASAGGRASSRSPVSGRELLSGTRVKRGPNWKWNTQDGGAGNEGVVVSGTEKNSDGWVRVKWDKGGVNGYRWGAELAYDVEPVDVNPLSKAIRDKDVSALLEAADDGPTEVSGTSGVLMEALAMAEEGVTHGKDAEVLTVLMERLGADPNKVNGGRLPLSVAAERARCDLVEVLLAHGARPDQTDGEGLTALLTLTRHLERTESAGTMLAEFGKVLRLLESREEEPADGLVRHLTFDKEGGQRNFGRSYPPCRFPSAACLDGEVSFTVAMRLKHQEPTGVRSGRAAVLCFGRVPSALLGFSVMMHTRGQTTLGPGISTDQHGCRINMAVSRGRWAVLSCVYDAMERTLTAYVDGEERHRVSLDDAGQRSIVLDPQGDILIGCTPEAVALEDRGKFHGAMSDVRIYNKALAGPELAQMHADMMGTAADDAHAHGHLRSPFCESIARVLLDKLRWSDVDGSSSSMRTHVSYLLSRVLPFCSPALLASDLGAALVRYLEVATISEASPAQNLSRAERRGTVALGADAVPRTMVSVLHCIDTVMCKAQEHYDGPLRRSGLVLRVSKLSSTTATTSTAASEHQQDLALYLIERYFGGEDGAQELPAEGREVRESLERLSAQLRRLVEQQRGGGDVAASSEEAMAVLKDAAALFRQGVYCEEFVSSGMAESLLDFLDTASNKASRPTPDETDAYQLLEVGFDATQDDRGALGALVMALRLAADRLPAEHPEVVPVVVPEQEHSGVDGLGLKQWVVLSLERSSDDKVSRDLTGSELQMEPLALVRSLEATLEAMLQTQSSKWKDKDSRGNGRQRELRAMMHAFGDDPDGAPPSLLDHIKHLMVHEPRSIDALPPITRQFLALPPVHAWDRDMTERGAVKQRLVLSRQNTGVDEDDDDMQEILGGERSSNLLSGARSTLDSVSGRESPPGEDGSALDKPRPTLVLQLRVGKTGQERGGSSGRAAMSEFAFVQDGETTVTLSDGAEESAGSSVGRGWLTGYRASLIDHEARLEASAAAADRAEHSVELRPDETIFEALCRLEAVAGAGAGRHRSGSQPGMHPGRFWERSFVLSYCQQGVEAVGGEDDACGEKKVLVEVPKSVLRFVTGRAGAGLRKIERESGARIVGPNRSDPEAVLRVTGTPEEVEEATLLIHSSARAAASWREARDAPILARNPRSVPEAPAAACNEGGGAGDSTGGEQSACGKRGAVDMEQGSSPEMHRTRRQRRDSEGADGLAQMTAASAAEDGGEALSSEKTSAEDENVETKCEDLQDLAFLGESRLRPCILLLHRLSSRFGSTLCGSDAFASSGLGLHLRRQLEDPLVVGSGMLRRMPWVMALCKLPPVIPLAVRERCFTACALGTSRALASCASSSSSSSSSSGEPPQVEESHAVVRAMGHAYGMHFASRVSQQELRVPALVRETVDIDHRREGHEDRRSLLEWADEVLTAHGARDTVLDVTWQGEAGHGAGPTRKFFEKVAALLESEEENDTCPVWRDVEAARREGLFPAALPDDNAERTRVLARLRLVGLFMGKALQQGQMPGLCLAKPLFKLIIGLPVDFHDVKDLDKELHAGVARVVDWRQRKDRALADAALTDDARRAQLEGIDSDTCMLWNEGGEQVTCGNLDAYTAEVVGNCMSKLEVTDQVAALREGISLVFPWPMLAMFQPAELQQKLWSDLEWDMAKLERIVRPGPMWPQDRDHIEWLRQELLGMDMRQRRAFVKFVTASVCMPLESNPIIVHPQVALRPETEDWDQKLPTCRTCANYLYLPPYSTASVLQQRLRLAMWEEHIAFD